MFFAKGLTFTMTVAMLSATSAYAAPISWSGPAGLSVLNGSNPNSQSVMSSTILAPQNTLLQTQSSKKQSDAANNAAANPNSNSTALLIQQQVESSIASQISSSITGANGSASSGLFDLGNGQSISYNRGASTTTVSIINPSSGLPLNLSFPNIH